jgi:hypothetical protein
MKCYPVLAVTLILTALCVTANADDSAKAKARQHFKHGVECFDERRFGDALSEFEQSYALVSVYSTLYNVGQVQVALGHPVEAVDAFEKFLTQGGASIAAEQRARVESEIRTQRERIGDVKLNVSPDGTEIRIDGNPVGKAPVHEPIRVAAGHHRVEALLDGYRSEQSEVDVPGKGHVEIMFKLQSLPQRVAAPGTMPAASPPPEKQPVPAANAAPTPVVNPPAHNGNSLPPSPGYAEPSSAGGVQRFFGYLLAGAGLVGGGVGIAYVVDGQSKHDRALTQWTNGDHAGAQQSENDSSKEKTQGFVVIGASGAVMLTGAILLIAAPSGHSGSALSHLTPWVGANTAGASLGGAW